MALSELAGLLLAAGGSRRLGQPKQLVRLDGQALVRRQALRMLAVVSQVTVVVGAEARAVGAELRHPGIRVVHNPRWREGMGSSLAAGIRSVPAGACAALVLLCDQFRVDVTDLERVLAAWRDEPARIVAAHWGDAYGPPAVFPRRDFRHLEGLRGETGARALLLERRSEVRFVPVDHAGHDLDDPADLETLSNQGER